jgi:acyl carrier protein
MWVWNEVYNKGDLIQLIRKEKPTYKELMIAYDKLMNSYIKEFGLSKQQRRLNKLKIQLVRVQLDYIITGQKVLLNKIKLLEKEIESINLLFFKQDSVKFNEFIVILQKWYGQKIDLKTTTVTEFYSIVKVYERGNKKERNSRGGRPR